MAKHDGVGGGGHWQGKGVGAGNASRKSEIYWVDTESHRHLGQYRHQHVGSGRVGGDIRYLKANIKIASQGIFKIAPVWILTVTVMTQMTKFTSHTGRLARSSWFSWEISKVESPDFCEASARANPPPSRKMTPQHILVSISLQVIREGELVMFLVQGENGQKS